jgi:hypothetical protein
MRLSNTIRPTEPSGVFALPCARGLWRRVSVHRRLCFETAADGSTNRLDRFTYDNYLCIARNHWHPGGTSATDRFVWDPTESVATRPLVFYQPNAPPQLYAHDGNKNVSELVSVNNGTITAHYEYSSFGEVILSSGNFALVIHSVSPPNMPMMHLGWCTTTIVITSRRLGGGCRGIHSEKWVGSTFLDICIMILLFLIS